MLSHLKNHPFAVETHFECSLVITYAVKKKELEDKIPACLSLDTFNDEWAFIAVALVSTKELRPKGFPNFMGNDFYLIGYRVFVQYVNNAGKRLRGLYILKSETDKKKMTLLGNIFTHYQYTTTDISFADSGNSIRIHSNKSKLEIHVEQNDVDIVLPPSSPFPDWKTARRFAGPLPFTFTYNQKKKEILIIEGVRTNWIPESVEIIRSRSSFIDGLNLKSAVLANAFIVRDVPYFWRKGKVERWKK